MPKLIMIEKSNAQDAGSNATQTLGELMTPKQPEPANDTVPLSKYMDEKRERRALEDRIAELTKSSTGDDLAGRLSTLAEKYEASPELLKEIGKVIAENKKDAMDSVDQKINAILPKFAELENSKKIEQFNKVFSDRFDTLIADQPEYKDVANMEVLKQLAMLPSNSHLTLNQLAENTYGNAVKGKKSIESGKSSGGSDTASVDFSKMTDEQWETVKQSPELKAAYGEYITKHVQL